MGVLFKEPRLEIGLMEQLTRYSRDYNWIKDNHSELLEEYYGKYVAVRNQRVLYHARTMKELVDRMLLRCEDLSKFAVEFVTDEKCCFFLF